MLKLKTAYRIPHSPSWLFISFRSVPYSRDDPQFYAVASILKGFIRQKRSYYDPKMKGWKCNPSVAWEVADMIDGLPEWLLANGQPRPRPPAIVLPRTYTEARQLFGLQPPITKDAIKQRYRTLAQHFHPDHGGDTQRMAAINVAYEFLIGK